MTTAPSSDTPTRKRLKPGERRAQILQTLAAMLQNPTREAERWASEGSVDRERLVWIADQIRGVPVRQRRALAAQLRAEQAVVAAASIRSLSVAGTAPHASTVRLAGAAVR